MSTLRPISKAAGRVTADFFTDSHRFSASIVVFKRQLIDVLSDKLTAYMDLVDIYVSRINKPGDIVGTYKRGSLVKEGSTLSCFPAKRRQFPRNGITFPTASVFPFL
jgi:hypothetical protein